MAPKGARACCRSRAATTQTLSAGQLESTVPRQATAATFQSLTAEGSTITPPQPSLGAVNLTPKNGGAVGPYSRQLSLLAPQLDRFLRADLLRAAGNGIDAAVLAGSGASASRRASSARRACRP